MDNFINNKQYIISTMKTTKNKKGKLNWKKFYTIMIIIIFFLSLMIIIVTPNNQFENSIRKKCINADEIINQMKQDPGREYRVSIINGYCTLKEDLIYSYN